MIPLKIISYESKKIGNIQHLIAHNYHWQMIFLYDKAKVLQPLPKYSTCVALYCVKSGNKLGRNLLEPELSSFLRDVDFCG